MTDKLGDKLGLKLSRIEPALYDETDDQVKTPCILFRFITGYINMILEVSKIHCLSAVYWNMINYWCYSQFDSIFSYEFNHYVLFLFLGGRKVTDWKTLRI